MNKTSSIGLLFAALLVALGIGAGGYFIGQTMYNAKVALNTAEVKGLAERRVEADRANWTIKFANAGKYKSDIPNLYDISEKNQESIVKILKESGFSEDEIKIGILNYSYYEYRDKDQVLVDQKHQLSGYISVETDKVKLIDKARAKVNKLIAKGINIEDQEPSYHFTKLNAIKPDMLKEATKNARIAANEFAANAGVKVGGIRSARQGNFNIRDVGEEYSNSRKIEKDIRVVTTITFYLTD